MNNKKFLLIEEQGAGTRKACPVVMEVTKETDGFFITPELYSVGIRDLAPTYIRKKVVRWNKYTGLRSGDDAQYALFRVKKVLHGLEEAQGVPNAIHVHAGGIQ